MKDGVLLLSDPSLPSVTRLIARERIAGSWWNHKKGVEIWHVLNKLTNSPNILQTRLLSAKVTFVHKRLWSDVFAVGMSRRNLRTARLSKEARRLMNLVTQKGGIRTDQIEEPGLSGRTVGEAARELEKILLVYSEEIHTEKGKHAKVLWSWTQWRENVGFSPKPISVKLARSRLEKVVAKLNEKYRANGKLPWQ
jgi:hypothetical protein